MAHILLIDDDPAIRMLIRRILEGVGHEVREAVDGQEGITLFAAAPVDVVITDILMPEKDGLSVIRELHAQHPEVPIVALSGGGMTITAGTSLYVAKKMGAMTSLEKPLAADALLAAIDQAMAQRQKET